MSIQPDHPELGAIGESAKKIRDSFLAHRVEYMFIGKASAIIQGFPGTTMDVDVFPAKNPENCAKVVEALLSIGFVLELEVGGRKVSLRDQILEGRDFVQVFDPFLMDIVFAPDGFENYEQAKGYKIDFKGYPLLSIKGIIVNKSSAKREKDLRDIPLLRDFQRELDER